MANKKQIAAYPPKVRARWHFLVEKAGKKVDEVCDLYLISRKTYYKWKAVDCGSRIYVSRKEHPETKIKGDIRICFKSTAFKATTEAKIADSSISI